jgi:GT2 family glycosyltransferase/glycosyltransferase involved in cell wall biosynthesis
MPSFTSILKLLLHLLVISGCALVALAFLVCELFYLTLFAWWRRPSLRVQPATNTGNKNASIIVLNWNGKDLLAECLPSVIEAAEYDEGDHEVIVVDNGSADGSVEFLKSNFPQVKLVTLEKNLYFIKGNQAGVKEARNDILVFLNNDMSVAKDFLRPLLDGFSDESVFAVSSQIFFPDPNKPRVETGKTRADWLNGDLDLRHELPTEADARQKYLPAFWLGGGSAAVDRRKYLEIGGFDTLMHPFYFEDTDLSYQAWKRGWRVLFCPESKVIHKHRASTSRLNRAYVERVIRRNKLLFVWKNITDCRFTLEHLVWLPLTLQGIRRQIGVVETAKVFWLAVGKLPEALCKRYRNRGYSQVTDRGVFKVANSAFEYKQRFIPPRQVRADDRLRILFVCPYLPSPMHGGGVLMFNLIRHLSEKHEVSLLSWSDNDEEQRYIPELESCCREVRVIRRREYHPGADRWQVWPRLMSIQFSAPEMFDALREMLVDGDYDIVQCEYVQMAYRLPQLQREAMVLREHEVQHAALLKEMKATKSFFRRTALATTWTRWLNAEVRLCRRFDRVIALTPQDARALRRYDPRLAIEVIPAGVDLSYYQPQAITEEPCQIAYLGNFRHTPNVDAAVYLAKEIFPLVKREIPEAQLCLIGSCQSPVVENLAKEEGVEITGWVEDTRPLLARASLLALPIRLGVGLRVKALEAWAMGKAIVATPLACAGVGARDNENVLLAEDPATFAAAIVRLLRDPQLRRQLGQAGRQMVSATYSWETVAAKQASVYREILRQNGRVS